LFFTFLGAYVVAFLVTIVGIAGGLTLDAEAKTPLIYALIVEVAASVVTLFKKTDFFEADIQAVKQKAAQDIASLKKEIDLKTSELETTKSEIEGLEKARAEEVLALRSECMKVTDAKDRAFEQLEKYKTACKQDVTQLNAKIEELQIALDNRSNP